MFPCSVSSLYRCYLTMTICSVEFCGNYNHKPGISPDIRFYKFPLNDATRSRQWKIACGDLKLIEGRSYFVCSRHFDETAFRAIDIVLKTAPSKRKLNDNAVPTLYLPRDGILSMSGEVPVAAPPPIGKRQLNRKRKAQAMIVTELMTDHDQESERVALAKKHENMVDSSTQTEYVCFSSYYFEISILIQVLF